MNKKQIDKILKSISLNNYGKLSKQTKMALNSLYGKFENKENLKS